MSVSSKPTTTTRNGLLTADLIAEWFTHFDAAIADSSQWLTELDTAIGDADHGIIIGRGASAVGALVRTEGYAGVGELLASISSTFAQSAGGAGGILFATFFQGLASHLDAKPEVSLVEFANAFDAGVSDIRVRGEASVGDKTMVDAFVPAAQALQLSVVSGATLPDALANAATAAASGRDASFSLVARRGRASYLGDRSANHLDPGAATVAILLESLARAAASHPHHQYGKKTMQHSRQFINRPDDVIDEALEGLAATHPALLRLDPAANLISRAEPAKGKVGLISGGGSGHEPLHAGFVGRGMLDVAVAGAVFASPTAQQVLAGMKLADSGAGVLQIVKNYTGDVLNFQIAAELAADDGTNVETVLVDDDLASESDNDGPGRRGTAAVITVEKVCGALAEQGVALSAIAETGRDIVARSRTLALTLDGCTHPGSSDAAFSLEPDEVEFGVGIHGERGTSRVPYADADTLTEQLVEPLVAAIGVQPGDQVIAIVNGLGGTYPLELSIVARRMHRVLQERGIVVARSLVGSFVTSLDMHGVSITLTAANEAILSAWDAPVRTPALSW